MKYIYTMRGLALLLAKAGAETDPCDPELFRMEGPGIELFLWHKDGESSGYDLIEIDSRTVYFINGQPQPVWKLVVGQPESWKVTAGPADAGKEMQHA